MVVRQRKGDGYTDEIIAKYNEYRKTTSIDRKARPEVDDDNAKSLNATLSQAAESTPAAPNGVLYESPLEEEEM